jgi:2-oxoisovalerate dehydrogenase E1 component
MNYRQDRRLAMGVPHRLYTEPVSARKPNWEAAVDLAVIRTLHRWIYTARVIDERESELVSRGEAYFQLASSGHEANAVFGLWLTADDWLAAHYRAKALLVARGMPIEAFFHNLLNTRDSQSGGRQMNPFASDPALRILPQNIPVGNQLLHAVGVAQELARQGDRKGIVLAGIGDGGTQQGESLEAIAEAVRTSAPVLFVVEDNAYAISTRTRGQTFYSLPEWAEPAAHYHGLPIQALDARDPVGIVEPVRSMVEAVRNTRRPGLLVLRLERLANHTNADDERVYRTSEERAEARSEGDPVAAVRRHMAAHGVEECELAEIERKIREQVEGAVEQARRAPDPPAERRGRPARDGAVEAAREAAHAGLAIRSGGEEAVRVLPRLTMIEAIRGVLRERLENDARVTLLGQDIEDPKGDVFGVTRGLSTAFPGRVRNAPLAEATILGTAIGQAMAGGRPVAFLQFADFLPVAYNQIHSELGSIAWRTGGRWSCPVIVLVACGGYRPGLGPFHSQTLESVLAHTPGIDVYMPSTPGDAAGLLQSAFDSNQPAILLYPKICLNDPSRSEHLDLTRVRIAPGTARRVRQGRDLTLVSWGSTMPLVEEAAERLERAGVTVDLWDLRSIAPWDRAGVVRSAEQTGRLIVVHEDGRTCGFGAEVAAEVAESLGARVRVKRVTRGDTLVPCNVARHLEALPSLRDVIEAAAELLDAELSWRATGGDEGQGAVASQSGSGERLPILARGSSPADHTVRVVQWLIRAGQAIQAGDSVAELEAEKALYTLTAPLSGRVDALIVPEGETVSAGAPIAWLEPASEPAVQRGSAQADPGEPVLKCAGESRDDAQATASSARESALDSHRLGTLPVLEAVSAARGGRVMTNEAIIHLFPGRSSEDIRRRTGIAERTWLAEGETLLGLAERACRDVLERSGCGLDQLDSLIVCTTTPLSITPSLACLLLERLAAGRAPAPEVAAYDILAACSGYLYALQQAYDLFRSRPAARVLVVTAEAMSGTVNSADFDTAILFGDAATATILAGPEAARPVGTREMGQFVRYHRPWIAARGEPGKMIRVPLPGTGPFHMDGLRVFAEAVKRMTMSLREACRAAEVSISDLELVVPHQANGRILDEVVRQLGIPSSRVANQIEKTGNTSSSSIPLVLADLLEKGQWPAGPVGLAAFGGGFTFGAAVLEREQRE